MGNPAEKMVSNGKMPGPVANSVLASGESTPDSGIYKLEQESHAGEQEIFIRKGTRLPFCRRCTGPLRFRLIKKLVYIADDPDFR